MVSVLRRLFLEKICMTFGGASKTVHYIRLSIEYGFLLYYNYPY